MFWLRFLQSKKIEYLDDRLVGHFKFGEESREIFCQECVVNEEIKFLSADRLGGSTLQSSMSWVSTAVRSLVRELAESWIWVSSTLKVSGSVVLNTTCTYID